MANHHTQGPTGIPEMKSKLLRSDTGSDNDLCGFSLWFNLVSTAPAGSQDRVLEKLVVSLHLSLFFPLFPYPFLPRVFPCSDLCVPDLGHDSLAQHSSKHRGGAVTGCCASLGCSNLPCAMRKSGASVNPLSLWAQLNQFSVHCLGLRVCTGTRRGFGWSVPVI